MRRAIDAASCTGEYADDLLALSNEAREFERRPEANYSYCLRNTAVYECLSYAADGKVRKRHITTQAHGTAFAYRASKGDYFLMTNDHVASWPMVTDEDHPVEEVPIGCKKTDEQLRLVRDENDDYEPGQIPVQRVVTDPLLDAAVVKTRHQLNVMPYRVGRSALLRAGNTVQIRGYPLGILQATNIGKVVSPYDQDREKGWNHVDFVTDALVTKGNSGSPVFAVSCRTGQLELVGLYHAGYKGSPALNTVVGIDQVRDLMENLHRSKPAVADDRDDLGTDAHSQIVEALRNPKLLPYFGVGDRVARAKLEPSGRIQYEIFAAGFPATDAVEIALEEEAGSGGALDTVSVVSKEGEHHRAFVSQLDAESQDVARNLFDLARRQFLLTVTFRSASTDSDRTRETFGRARDLAAKLEGRRAQGQDLLRSTSEVASRLPVETAAPTAEVRVLPGTLSDLATELESDHGAKPVPPAPVTR